MADVDRFQRVSSGGCTTTGRSRRRERTPHAAAGEREDGAAGLRPRRGNVTGVRPIAGEGVRGEGKGHIRRQANSLMVASDFSTKNKIQHNKVAFELMHGSPKKASGTSIKMLIDQEMSKGVPSRRHAPNLIAKLMGLDTLPAQQLGHMRKESVSDLHKGSSEGFLDKHLFCEEQEEEFKDVFEVLETEIAEDPGNWSTQKQLPKSRGRHKEMEYARQKFADARHLSTDEKLFNCKQFSEALEVLESNKDLFLKLLQEPSSLFIKHLEEYQSTPTNPEASHIMILKASDVTEYDNSEVFQKLDTKTERNTHIKKNAVEKYESDFISHCIKEHNVSLSKLLKYKHEGKTEASFLPTRIVVLKPNLENVRETVGRENSPSMNFGYRRCRESRRSGTGEIFYRMREQNKFSRNVILMNKTRGSREIAKEISKRMMQTFANGSVKSFGPSRREKSFMDLGTLSLSSDQFGNSYCSSSYSTETSANREARRHLSERWKMTHKIQDVRVATRGLSTLGEMLALSDREKPDMPLCSSSCQKNSHHKLTGKEVVARWGGPLGISSQDAWKHECSSSLSKSESLPALSFIYGGMHTTRDNDNSMLNDVMDPGSRNSSVRSLFDQRLSSPYGDVKICSSTCRHSNHVGFGDRHHLWDNNVNQDEFQNNFNIKKLLEENFAISEPGAGNHSDVSYLVNCVPVVCDEGSELPCAADEQPPPHSLASTVPVDDEYSVLCDEKQNVTKKASSDERQTESHPCATAQVRFPISKMAEHPSPVSVLEPLDENELSPECSERANIDLQELHMQLQLLNSESSVAYAEDVVITSVKDDGGEHDGVMQARGIQLTFRDDDNMVFHYLLEVLTDSGFCNADWDMLSCNCFSPESPMGPDVFEKLENMYGHDTWSRTDRKLLFDLINSVLAEILASSDPHTWIEPRRIRFMGCHNHIVDETWQSLDRLRKDGSGDPVAQSILKMRWLDLGDDVDMVGREIERMVNDDLMEELLLEIMLPEASSSMDRSAHTCRHCGGENILSAHMEENGTSRSQPAVLYLCSLS